MPDQPISITDPNLQKLYDYWLRKQGTRLAPMRADLDPLDLKYIPSFIYIIDVIGPPYRFQCQLAESRVAQEFGGELTENFVDEIDYNRVGDLILDEYESVTRDGRPTVAKWHNTKKDGQEIEFEHLILPLSSDGTNIDMLLVGATTTGILTCCRLRRHQPYKTRVSCSPSCRWSSLG